ncbi:alpha/beta fold hydrolase [Virgibacillus dakarensis]|uniref:Carboxylesterase n=1 Tax=Lentibacillus populi TaxID=1827502 RepID=A0A9W5U1K7_9BACI|nr:MULTISPECIES: alpha/beta fold hydrolase [Bacillaceae]MBT2218320.1 alpha/beta fold hydrolase [Virgibacillus dakarensis]MTW85682.1 alpha/beta fold hydrolase [Virgibacillus dakarensis]GGB55595.1 carboxylesterase [Lentibacillus populi]
MIGCLIIHGYTGGPYEVDPLASFLTENTNWHITVPTLPGHGKKLTLKDISHKRWIQAAENTLEQMLEKYDEIYLIGFSMGGMIASYLAAKYNVTKLVLLAPAGKYLSFTQICRDIGGVVADGLRGTLNKNKLYLHYKRKLGAVPFKANLEFLKLVKYTKPYLKKVDTPVLIAQGQQDGMVPYKTAYYLEKEITSKQKEIVFFERSRHLICLGNDKDTLNSMVYSFLIKDK